MREKERTRWFERCAFRVYRAYRIVEFAIFRFYWIQVLDRWRMLMWRKTVRVAIKNAMNVPADDGELTAEKIRRMAR